MVEPGCWDDNLMDEDIESLLNSFDFPLENFDEDGLGFGGGLDSSLYEFLGPIPSDALMGLPPVPRTDIANSCLNAVSNSNAPNEFPEAQGSGLFQSQSPVSVLEQSSFCSGGKSASFNIVTKRRRSTRARSSTLNPWLLMAPLSSTAKKIYDAKKGNEKKKRKQAALSGGMESKVGHKCTHCQVTKTPQWREGPLGPKTLCNACGVRYRKGRLFPEYRPAASPTFIPTLHSNSHRKVIEMRRKAVEESLGDIPDEIFARPYNSAGNLFPFE